MIFLLCTGQVQNVLGLRKENMADAEPSDAPLGNWYINRFSIDRRKAFIFMSQATFLSFILLQGKVRVTERHLIDLLFGGLEQLLRFRGLSATTIDNAFMNCDPAIYARTRSRGDLGSLNDLVALYSHQIYCGGGVEHCDLTDITMKVNETPQRKFQWCSAWEMTQGRLVCPA